MRRALAAATAAALVAFVAQAYLDRGGAWADRLFGDTLYFGLELAGAVACLVRAARVRGSRRAWALVGLGGLAYAIADLTWRASEVASGHPWFVDAFWIASYFLVLAGMVLLLADGDHGATGLWIDGVIGALVVGAVAVAFAFDPVLDRDGQASVAAVLQVAYPLSDLVLVGFVVLAFATQGWRPGRCWSFLGLGAILIAVADTVFTAKLGDTGSVESSIAAALWPAALVSWGWAAWQPQQPRRTDFDISQLTFALPAVFAFVALGLIILDQFEPVARGALLLATAALLLATIRAGWTFREYTRLLRTTQKQALTDGLTGLPNRRRLMIDLEHEIRRSSSAHPAVLAFFDLDGFKGYNDTFGHAEGDKLLQRLGSRLAEATAGAGAAYRLGGDEFCVVLSDGARDNAAMERATLALHEAGDGYRIGASRGTVILPAEASSVAQALQIADTRMYAHKEGSRRGGGRRAPRQGTELVAGD